MSALRDRHAPKSPRRPRASRRRKPVAADFKVAVLHDTRLSVPDTIASYWHCSRCLKELPIGVSPRDWARTQCGVTPEGRVQVVCTRHGLNITTMTFEVRPVKTFLNPGDELMRPGEECEGLPGRPHPREDA